MNWNVSGSWNGAAVGGVTIIENGPSFTGSVSASVTLAGSISVSIIGSGPSFTDAVLISIPALWIDKVPATTIWTDL